MKTAFKQLKKKLENKFDRPSGKDYAIKSSVGLWVSQCEIKPTSNHLNIICTIFGSVPYPYQEADRKKILKYLKKNKYKDFKKL